MSTGDSSHFLTLYATFAVDHDYSGLDHFS